MKKKEIIPEPTDIDFDGTIVKLKNGVYKCPFHCNTGSGYPAQKWKTEKGFRQYMLKCPKSPSFVKRRFDEINLELEAFNKMKAELLPTLPYTIGQKIYYVREIITKPTHEKRWNRMVRVRYEEEKRFSAEEDEIKTIDVEWDGYVPKDIDSMKHYVVLNGRIKLRTLCDSYKEAIEKAIQDKIKYDEACEFAYMCR
jgi:hypothetical protein